jgi:lipopolysaccharide transport system ATP-binding protein
MLSRSDDVAIRAEGLGKKYALTPRKRTVGQYTLRETLAERGASAIHWIGQGTGHRVGEREFWALRDISFDVRRGEVVAVIGRNGAGKSTLLKILCRVTRPTEGRGFVRGRLLSILEIGSGFHPDLTGRENIFLKGALIGMRKPEITRQFDAIVAFAGVEKFLDMPVKRYSTGMYMRLAFAACMHSDPEVLIVDEALSVGDNAFNRKCSSKLTELAASGTAIIMVSHRVESIRALAGKAILLEHGRVVADGAVEDVLQTYSDNG